MRGSSVLTLKKVYKTHSISYILFTMIFIKLHYTVINSYIFIIVI